MSEFRGQPYYNFDAMAHTPGAPTMPDTNDQEQDSAHLLREFVAKVDPEMLDRWGIKDPDDVLTWDTAQQWGMLRKLLNDPEIGAVVRNVAMESLFLPHSYKLVEETGDGLGISLIDPLTDLHTEVNAVVMHFSEIPAVVEALLKFYESVPQATKDAWDGLDDPEGMINKKDFRSQMIEAIEQLGAVGMPPEVQEKMFKMTDKYIEDVFGDREEASRGELIELTENMIDAIIEEDDDE